MTKLTEKQLEDLTFEVIEFLQKWGLWDGNFYREDSDVCIYVNNKRYSSCKKEGSELIDFRGLKNVYFKDNFDPQSITYFRTKYNSNFETEICFEPLFGDNKIFNMEFEDSLSTTIYQGQFAGELKPNTKLSDAEKEFFENHLEDIYYLCQLGPYNENDPIDYEDYVERYLPQFGDEQFQSYDEYLELTDWCDPKDWKSGESSWKEWLHNKVFYCIKRFGIRESTFKETEEVSRALAGLIYNELDDIFRKYGLWFEFQNEYAFYCEYI